MDAEAKLVRLAFVQQWSDALLACVQQFYADRGSSQEEVSRLVQQAADDWNLSALRVGGDARLADAGAQALGFANAEALRVFQHQHPMLSAQWSAPPALQPCEGTVVAMSRTEVILECAGGSYVSAGLGSAVLAVGDRAAVSRFGAVRKVAEDSA